MNGSDSDGSYVAGESDAESEFQYDPDAGSEDDAMSQGVEDDNEMVIEPPEVRKAPYAIMNRAELAERQSKCITEAAELLQVSPEEGFVLLRSHAWDLLRLQEAWFDDDRKVRERCGLDPTGATPSSSSKALGPGKCSICMNDMDLISLSCSHGFCSECWTGYLHTQVDEGKAAVSTRCPQHKCSRIVPSNFYTRFCDEDRRKKYQEWCLRTYVEENSSVKWCTNPVGCQFCCEYGGVDTLEIRCNCSYTWCWGCGEEAHRPASCKTVNQWNIKNSAESENISWIRANTKKCPKCHKPIEKNQGCNHMVCSKAGGCGHEFCWLCLGDWAAHGTSTGGYYQCNIYDKQSKEGKHADEEKTRLRAKHDLDKYMFYFERFMNHDRAMKLTVKEEKEIEQKVEKMHEQHGFAIIELQFLHDALIQVRVCRQVLKWTYVYGYYHEDNSEKTLFEHIQKNLEEKTDRLHEMLERDFDQIFFNENDKLAPASPDAHAKFMDFRGNATNLSNIILKWRAQILEDIGSEGGLAQTLSKPSR
eukprot:TRINITY_DN3153_c0_g1_i1.p1 TRINITY_DN3153_c0_g1~~TRINITY_DN3153_c0_g1_i1.p1  ORF type:complete len:532 (-),score=94.03 TRINITY_DN3153_c0_g1_i1:91-1686(-)